MDNIKDRQFYWEVKQFFNGKPENNVPPQPKPSLKDAVSGVLKENNPYKQTNFSNNPTSVNIAQNVIQGLGAMDAANKPSCVAYTKNAIKNPFNLNEGFWDIARDQANNPEKYDLGVVGKISANVANFFGGFGPSNKPRESTGTASTDKSGNTVFNPTPVQTQTPKPASAPAPVQGQSQAPNAQTKAPVQGQPQSVPAKNQPTTTSTTPYTRQYVSSEPEGQPKRGPGGGVIAPPVPLDDRKASDMPGAYQDKRMEVTMNLPPIKNDIGIPSMKGGASLSQRTQPMASGGQYRGSSNMGMATRPNRPEAMTLQSAMAQQNQQATRNALGQMGAVEGAQNTMANSSSGFRGSVLPPASQLTSMGTQKENEFKYARGSRLA
jgi:hypothetical protein